MPGVAFHMNDMETHCHAITQIAGNFIASPEFKSTYGENISEETYINLLYQNVLGRFPADFDVEYYTERSHRARRIGIQLWSFLQSLEKMLL